MLKKNKALVIGNGPSTKLLLDYGFHNIPTDIDTYCTSNAYKFCSEINWWPTYYIMGDFNVFISKLKIFEEIVNDTSIGVKGYYFGLPKDYKKHFIEYKNIKDTFKDTYNKVKWVEHKSSGYRALSLAIDMKSKYPGYDYLKSKYDSIGMIGMDGQYTWYPDKMKSLTSSDRRAKYMETIEKHPSYFWPNYIEKDDHVCDIPQNPEINATKMLKLIQGLIDSAKHENITIYDYCDNRLDISNKTKDLNLLFK